MKCIMELLLKKAAVIITVCLLVVFAEQSVFADNSGKCGENLTWTLEEGVLEISGSGKMTDYTEHTMSPWYDAKDDITAIIFKADITSIGDLAFYECTNIESITLPDTVKEIGDMTFAGCISLERVTIEEGLEVIGRSAFARCESLSGVRLPESLTTLSYQAFYRCSSLSSIRIPGGVKNFESSTFAYCTSLMQAVVEWPINALPEWTFYGCSSLVDVSLSSNILNIGEYAFYNCNALDNTYHSGTEENRNQVSIQIQQDVPGFSGVVEGDSSDIGVSSIESSKNNSDGSHTVTEKETAQTDNVFVNTTVEQIISSEQTSDEYNVSIDVSIDNEDGWGDMFDYIDKYIEYPERLTDDNTTVNKVQINVNLKGDAEVPSDVLQYLAGKKVSLNVSSGAYSDWTIDCETLDRADVSGDFELDYTLTKNEKPTKAQKKLIGDVDSYIIEFADNIDSEMQVKVRLGITYARQIASFCQKPTFKSWEIVQSVFVDSYGYATFYLGNIDKHTEYLIAINVVGVDVSDVLVPESMSEEYGGLMDAEGNRYEITGVRSAFGISFWQLTLIVIGVVAVSIVVVGIIVKMFAKAKYRDDVVAKRKGKGSGRKSE